MNNDDLTEFLKKRNWNYPDQTKLINEFNSRLRSGERPINFNSVRTPCRLKQIVGSLQHRIHSDKSA